MGKWINSNNWPAVTDGAFSALISQRSMFDPKKDSILATDLKLIVNLNVEGE